MSAIHNRASHRKYLHCIVSDVQRYKICQQFTTITCPLFFLANCFRRAKIQNLSAIHNKKDEQVILARIVSDVQRYKICQQFTTATKLDSYFETLIQTCKDTKFVSNSQPSSLDVHRNLYCFRRAKIQNLSAIHNTFRNTMVLAFIVSDVQRYKICQQFTTKTS